MLAFKIHNFFNKMFYLCEIFVVLRVPFETHYLPDINFSNAFKKTINYYIRQGVSS